MILQIHLLAQTERDSCARLLEMIDPKQSAVIADMGSGFGSVAEHMQSLRPDLDVFSINNDPAQHKATQFGYPVLSDYHNVPLKNECCDVVMFNYSIGYADLPKAFAEANRILKPNGTMFLWDFVGDSKLMKDELNYNTYSSQQFEDAAKGFKLDWVKQPETFTENCYSVLSAEDAKLLDNVKKEVIPTAFRFTKVKYGLAFSGGKDSLACLMLYRHKLDEITVFWVNNGKNYPELLETVEKYREMCPNFIEVNNVRGNAIPADIVPVDWTEVGQLATGKKDFVVQSYLDCCLNNIAMPLHNAVAAHGITHLIVGQRNDEAHKSTTKNDDVVLGVIRIHPLENWTKQEVMAYLATMIDIPEHLHLNHSSMDCYDCTAFEKDSQDRIEFTKRHPVLFAEYEARKNQLSSALKEAHYG